MSKSIEAFYSENEKLGENGESHFLSATSLRKEESYELYNIVKKYRPAKTLEVGLALGGSTVAIVAAKADAGIQEKHTALDPFQKMYANNAGLVALRKLGMDNQFVLFEEFSEHYFNKMHQMGQSFDFIFIDGSHTIGQAVADAFLADKILNDQGIIGIHDSLLFSTAASIKYLMLEKGYRIVSGNNNSVKRVGRQVKYIRKLGVWYCINVVPRINVSIVFLQKNKPVLQ